MTTMELVNPAELGNDDNYKPQSPEPSERSATSTPPTNLSTTEGWKTPHTASDDNTFYLDDEFCRIYFLPSFSTPPLPSRKMKRKLSLGMSFPKKRGSDAARLRGLWTIAPRAERHTRFIGNKLKSQDWKRYINIKCIIFPWLYFRDT